MDKPHRDSGALSYETHKNQVRAQKKELVDQRLDEELKQTFPASDPLPWRHDNDLSARAAEIVKTALTRNESSRFEDLIPEVANTDHALGPAHAPVTIVEYGDFECPTCRQAASALKILLQHFEGKIRLVFRHFPLELIHPHALRAAEAAECAGAQGKFWEMHDLLFEHQLHLRPTQIRACAESLNLDMAQFDAALHDEIYLQRIREHQQFAKRVGIHSTPAFFINDRLQDVSFGMHGLKEGVEAALAERTEQLSNA